MSPHGYVGGCSGRDIPPEAHEVRRVVRLIETNFREFSTKDQKRDGSCRSTGYINDDWKTGGFRDEHADCANGYAGYHPSSASTSRSTTASSYWTEGTDAKSSEYYDYYSAPPADSTSTSSRSRVSELEREQQNAAQIRFYQQIAKELLRKCRELGSMDMWTTLSYECAVTSELCPHAVPKKGFLWPGNKNTPSYGFHCPNCYRPASLSFVAQEPTTSADWDSHSPPSCLSTSSEASASSGPSTQLWCPLSVAQIEEKAYWKKNAPESYPPGKFQFEESGNCERQTQMLKKILAEDAVVNVRSVVGKEDESWDLRYTSDKWRKDWGSGKGKLSSGSSQTTSSSKEQHGDRASSWRAEEADPTCQAGESAEEPHQDADQGQRGHTNSWRSAPKSDKEHGTGGSFWGTTTNASTSSRHEQNQKRQRLLSPQAAAASPSVPDEVDVAAAKVVPRGSPRPTPGKKRCAFVIFLWGDSIEYVLGACVLGKSLLLTQTRHELLCLHTDDVPELSTLRKFWTLREIAHIPASNISLFRGWKAQNRFCHVFTKLRALELEEYDKVLLMDIDMCVKRNIDLLFELPTPAAMRRGANNKVKYAHGEPVDGGCFFRAGLKPWQTEDEGPSWEYNWTESYFQGTGINAGLMLFSPDRRRFEDTCTVVRTARHPSHINTTAPEQDFLSRYFADAPWHNISVRFNYQLHQIFHNMNPLNQAERKQYFDDAGRSRLAVIHYSGKLKPWHHVCDSEYHDWHYKKFVAKCLTEFETYYHWYLKKNWTLAAMREAGIYFDEESEKMYHFEDVESAVVEGPLEGSRGAGGAEEDVLEASFDHYGVGHADYAGCSSSSGRVEAAPAQLLSSAGGAGTTSAGGMSAEEKLEELLGSVKDAHADVSAGWEEVKWQLVLADERVETDFETPDHDVEAGADDISCGSKTIDLPPERRGGHSENQNTKNLDGFCEAIERALKDNLGRGKATTDSAAEVDKVLGRIRELGSLSQPAISSPTSYSSSSPPAKERARSWSFEKTASNSEDPALGSPSYYRKTTYAWTSTTPPCVKKTNTHSATFEGQIFAHLDAICGLLQERREAACATIAARAHSSCRGNKDNNINNSSAWSPSSRSGTRCTSSTAPTEEQLVVQYVSLSLDAPPSAPAAAGEGSASSSQQSKTSSSSEDQAGAAIESAEGAGEFPAYGDEKPLQPGRGLREVLCGDSINERLELDAIAALCRKRRAARVLEDHLAKHQVVQSTAKETKEPSTTTGAVLKELDMAALEAACHQGIQIIEEAHAYWLLIWKEMWEDDFNALEKCVFRKNHDKLTKNESGCLTKKYVEWASWEKTRELESQRNA